MLFFVVAVARSLALEIPMFPVRQPRFPTETLKLKLFEPRYVALAREVLSSEHKVFAAVYCGDVASVLPRGSEPPTPLVAPPAVGVLCEVSRWEENENFIKLEASAFARCRVSRVASTPAMDTTLPYIVVCTEPLLDEAEEDASDEEAEAAAAVTDVENLIGKVWGRSDYDALEDDNSDDSKRHAAVRRFMPNLLDEECEVPELERQCLLSSACSGFSPSRTELFSYALLATLTLSPKERQDALECTDTVLRLKRVSDELSSGRSWLAARAAISDLFC